MKKRTIGLTLTTIAFFAFTIQTGIANKINNSNEELIKLITEMTNRYNQHRVKTSEIYNEYGYDSEEMILNEGFIAETDAKNAKQAKEVFEDYGYPSVSMVGTEKAHEFWIIVQTCNYDTEFQLKVLKKMDMLLQKNEVSKQDYAYLSDRVRLNLGMKQIYGTQVKYNEKTKTYEPYELSDRKKVENRRKEMELEPMDTYILSMNSKYQGSLKRNQNTLRLKKKR